MRGRKLHNLSKYNDKLQNTKLGNKKLSKEKVKVYKPEVDYNKRVEVQKKKSKSSNLSISKGKKIMIGIIIGFILLLVLFFVLFIGRENKNEVKPKVKEEVKLSNWQEKYYIKLKEDIIDKGKDKKGHEITTAEVYKQLNPVTYMLEIDNHDIPVMVVESDGYKTEYQDDNNKELEKVITIYSINPDDQVIYYNLENAHEVVMLYNIENNSYEWFIHSLSISDHIDTYISVREILDYIYSNQSDEKKPTSHKVDEIDNQYIVVNDITIDKEKLVFSSLNLKKLVKSVSQKFKKNSDFITDEVSSVMEKKTQEIEQKKQEEEKKAQEEVKRKEEEEAEKARKIQEQQQAGNNSSGNTITKEQAVKLCEKQFGTNADGTQVGYGYAATVKDPQGNSYYAINAYGILEGWNSYWGTYYVKTDGSLYKIGSGEGGRNYYEGQVVNDFYSEGKFTQ